MPQAPENYTIFRPFRSSIKAAIRRSSRGRTKSDCIKLAAPATVPTGYLIRTTVLMKLAPAEGRKHPPARTISSGGAPAECEAEPDAPQLYATASSAVDGCRPYHVANGGRRHVIDRMLARGEFKTAGEARVTWYGPRAFWDAHT